MIGSLRASDADGHHWVVVLVLFEGSRAPGDGDLLLASVDDVAVLAVRQPGEEADIVEVAHGKEALLSSAEPEAAVLNLPVALRLSSHGVGELDHVGNRRPPVLADPPVVARARWIWLRSRRTLVTVVEVVGRHDSLEAVLLGQHETDAELVVVIILVSQHSTGTSVTPLIVVIVDKGDGMESIAQAVTEVVEAVEVSIPEAGHLVAAPEFRDLAQVEVI